MWRSRTIKMNTWALTSQRCSQVYKKMLRRKVWRSKKLINFELPEKGFTSVRIYDNNGQLIRILISEQLNAGEYEIKWDGMDSRNHSVPSGIYFCNLKTSGASETIKICFMK